MARLDFCTICSADHAIKAVALHRSLTRESPSAWLTVIAMDDEARAALERMELPRASIVSIEALERFDPDLKAVRPGRTPEEYCWTAKTSALLYLLGSESGSPWATYVDADMAFFGDPAPIYEDEDASVLITPHRFPPKYAAGAEWGDHNAGFLAFRGDEPGRELLDWQRERCLEWCHARVEEGRAGDQLYLNELSRRPRVRPLAHKGVNLAPWNVEQYELRREDGRLMVDEDPVVLYHCWRITLRARKPFRLRPDHDWRPSHFELPDAAAKLIYRPYLRELDASLKAIRRATPGFSAGVHERVS